MKPLKSINLKQFVTTKLAASSLQTHIQQSEKNTKSGKLFLTCDKLPLDIYIDCLIDNDLTGLIIDGWASPEKLEEVWNKIYIQSLELSQSPSFNEAFTLNKKIEDLRAKIHIADISIKFLQLGYDKEIVDVINSLAIICDITEADEGLSLIKKLNYVIAQIKPWFPELKQKEKELAALRAKNTEGKTDRAYFDGWLDIMSEEKGYQVEATKITVSRFYRSLIKISEKAMIETIKSNKNGRSTR